MRNKEDSENTELKQCRSRALGSKRYEVPILNSKIGLDYIEDLRYISLLMGKTASEIIQ